MAKDELLLLRHQVYTFNITDFVFVLENGRKAVSNDFFLKDCEHYFDCYYGQKGDAVFKICVPEVTGKYTITFFSV